MSTQEERVIQIIEEMEQLIRDGVDEYAEVAEGWLEDWDDVEYRIMKSGEYRGVALSQWGYSELGDEKMDAKKMLDVEIDTAKMMISVLDTETDQMVAFRYVEPGETLEALQAIDRMWEDEFYREKEQ